MFMAEFDDAWHVLVDERLTHCGRDDLFESPWGAFGDDILDGSDLHSPIGQFPLDPRLMSWAVGRVLLAHDTTQITVVWVGIEGDAPRAGSMFERSGFSRFAEGHAFTSNFDSESSRS